MSSIRLRILGFASAAPPAQALAPPAPSASGTAEVYDIRGGRVFRSVLAYAGAGRRLEVGLPAGLQPGVYFVSVEQSGRSATARVAIIH